MCRRGDRGKGERKDEMVHTATANTLDTTTSEAYIVHKISQRVQFTCQMQDYSCISES